MISAIQALQDMIDNLEKQITETEGVIQAQQGCLVALKRVRNDTIARKRSIEEQEKADAQAKETEKARKRPKKKSGQTPLK